MKRIVYIGSLFLLVSFFGGCQSKTDQSEEKELPKELVDRIELTDLDGKALPLDSFKGKTIFLNYWATWCRPCLAEMPDLDKAAQILGEEKFVFLAASDEDLEKVKKFAAKFDYSFQFVHSKTSVFDLDIMALPTTMIINGKGEIVYNEVGARDWASENELDNLRKFAQK
jgi:thiol-disulfide isomerase/thioredoxin